MHGDYIEAWPTAVTTGVGACDVATSSRSDTGSRVPSPRPGAETARLAHGKTTSDGEGEPGNVHRSSPP